MTEKYLRFNVVQKQFAAKELAFNFEDLCDYVRNKTIHPAIYIDSVPALAYQITNQGKAAIGVCHLSAYWHINNNELVGLCDNLLRKIPAWSKNGVNKDEISQIAISFWCTESDYFEEVPKDLIQPKAFSQNLMIDGFIFPENNRFFVETRHICISEKDLTILNTHVLPADRSKNKVIMKPVHIGKNNSGSRQPNRLQLLIQKKLMESKSKSAEAIWRQIRNDREDYELWIDKIDPWGNGREEAAIKWSAPSVTDKTMKRAAFETYVSELNTGKKAFAEEQYDELYED